MTKLKEIFFGKTKPGKEQGGTRVSRVGECSSHLVVSDSATLMQPARLLCPWDFPGKNIGVGCHFLLQGLFTHGSNLHLLHWEAVFTETVARNRPTLCSVYVQLQSPGGDSQCEILKIPSNEVHKPSLGQVNCGQAHGSCKKHPIP